MKTKRTRKILSTMLALLMVLGMPSGGVAFAADEANADVCSHNTHPTHTGTGEGGCGYVAEVEGGSCTHTAHDLSCYDNGSAETADCTHTHAEGTCGDTTVNALCNVHTAHDLTCYGNGSAATTTCTHTDHDSSCNTPGVACSFNCNLCQVSGMIADLPEASESAITERGLSVVRNTLDIITPYINALNDTEKQSIAADIEKYEAVLALVKSMETDTITVTFVFNSGSMAYEQARVASGSALAVVNSAHKPIRAAYAFIGWSIADDGTADSGDTLITTDCTLYAIWLQDIPPYDDNYDPPPHRNPSVNIGGDYDAILRDDVVIVRGDEPISGTLDLGKTNADAIRLPEDAVKASAISGSSVTIYFPDDTAATINGSGFVAAEDALRSGESLQISVTKVDAGALPEELTTPPEVDEPFEDDYAITHYVVFAKEGIFTYDELLKFGVFGGDDESISWGDMKLLYHYMTTEDLETLHHRFSDGSEDLVPFVAWLAEMMERDGVELPFTYNNLLDYADFTDEQIGKLSKPDDVGGSEYPTIGQLRELGLTLEQMQLLQSNAEELREGASAEEQAQYDALLSWLEDAIAQKELEKENATITSMTLNGLEEYADLTDKQMQLLSDMGLQNLDNPSIGQIKKLDLTLEQMELLYAEIDRARSAEYNPAYQAEYGVLLNWLEEAISEKEQDEQKADTTYINIGGERFAFVSALEVDVKAVKVSGSTRNIEILADRSNAVQWSTNIGSAALEEMLATMGNASADNDGAQFGDSMLDIRDVELGEDTDNADSAYDPKLLLDAPEWSESNIRAYKVLDDGTLEAKAAKVIVNADGTLILSAMSDGNSTYIFVLEPNPYTDIDEGDWYFDAAMTMDQRLLMTGTTAATFSPKKASSRAMIAAMLYRLDGEPTITGESPFSDVKSGKYYYDAVLWAAENEIVTGYNGKFDPNTDITREQLAAILWRYAKYKGCDVSIGEDTNILSYNDAFDVSEYAIPAMQWASGEGIVTGKTGGSGNGALNLDPQGDATRAETAAMFQRFLEASEK